MSIYVFGQRSVIDEVAVLTTESGSSRAYLHAGPASSRQALAQAKEKLHQQGWQCIPVTYLGRPTLEVRGFGKPETFLKFLSDQHITSGPARHYPTSDAEITFTDKLRKRTLQASGGFYALGDVGFFTYGWKEGSWEDMAAGLAYAAGTWSIAAFGKNDQSDIQVQDVSRRMLRHAMNKSVQLPQHSAIAQISEEKDKAPGEQIYDTFKRYPSEMFCAFTGLAGFLVAASAFRHKVLATPKPGLDAKAIRDMRREGLLDVGLGTTTMLATAIGGLMTEKHRDVDEPAPTDFVGKAWEWVREKPLRVTGYGLMISTLCHAGSTAIAYKEAMRLGDTKRNASVPFRAAFVGANLIAEFLMAISSKGHGEGVKSDNTVDESCYAIAAELISRQPPSLQNGLVDYMAEYLQRPEVLGGEKSQIAGKIHEQLKGMQTNPWVDNTPVADPVGQVAGWQNRTSQHDAAPDHGYYFFGLK